MRTSVLLLFTVFAAVPLVGAKILILHDQLSIKASQSEEVQLFCNSNYTYAQQISVTSAEKNLIMRDDTFEVHTKMDCSSNSYFTALSSQGSAKGFTWSKDHPGQLVRGRGLCVKIQCTNYFMACNAEYSLIVDCI